MTLLQFITDPSTGKIKRGAMSRVSEYTGLSQQTLKRYMDGTYMPSIESIRKINDAIHARIDLSPRQTGRKENAAKDAEKDAFAESLQVAAELAQTERRLAKKLKELKTKIPRSFTL